MIDFYHKFMLHLGVDYLNYFRELLQMSRHQNNQIAFILHFLIIELWNN